MQVVIVGGGIAGLWLALRVLGDSDENSVIVLEANKKIGGRIRTYYDPSGNPVLEEGAWRIPNSHSRVMSLCRELGLEMRQVKSENDRIAETEWFDCSQTTSCSAQVDCSPNVDMKYGISMWDALALTEGVPCAQESVAKTGYAGADAMAMGTNAYDVEAIFKQSNEAEGGGTYWVPKLGLSSICDALATRICEHPTRARIRLEHRVSHVEALGMSEDGKRFQVTSVAREGKNAHREETFRCDAVVLAIPPEQAKKVGGVSSFISPVLETLEGVSLFKAFCAVDDSLRLALGLQSPHFHLKANNMCQQVISSTYPGRDIIQVAYCSGQRADALEHFRLCGRGRRAISEDVSRIAQGDDCAAARIRELLLRRRMKFYYWKNAVHIWLPTFPSFNVANKSSEACVLPSAQAPGLFLCGEAYSTIQGWSEGALETAEHVLGVLRSMNATCKSSSCQLQLAKLIVSSANLKQMFTSRIPRSCVVVFGRIVDVKHWKKVHPGGKKAIENHEGEDISLLFQGALHPSYAEGIAFALQIGWCELSLSNSRKSAALRTSHGVGR